LHAIGELSLFVNILCWEKSTRREEGTGFADFSGRNSFRQGGPDSSASLLEHFAGAKIVAIIHSRTGATNGVFESWIC
jgi:hypothetical protein